MGLEKDGKYIGFYISVEDHARLREIADIEGCATINRLVRELICKAIREREKSRTKCTAVS